MLEFPLVFVVVADFSVNLVRLFFFICCCCCCLLLLLMCCVYDCSCESSTRQCMRVWIVIIATIRFWWNNGIRQQTSFVVWYSLTQKTKTISTKYPKCVTWTIKCSAGIHINEWTNPFKPFFNNKRHQEIGDRERWIDSVKSVLWHMDQQRLYEQIFFCLFHFSHGFCLLCLCNVSHSHRFSTQTVTHT